MSTIPTETPTEVRSGDSWQWRKALDDYPASSYTLRYFLVKSDSPLITLTATADGDEHLIDETPTTTAGYAAGTYFLTAQVDDGADFKKTIESKAVEVLPNISAASTGLEVRDYWERIKEAAQASLLGIASDRQASLSVGGMSVSMRTPSELLELITECDRKILEANRKAGRGRSQQIKVAFK